MSNFIRLVFVLLCASSFVRGEFKPPVVSGGVSAPDVTNTVEELIGPVQEDIDNHDGAAVEDVHDLSTVETSDMPSIPWDTFGGSGGGGAITNWDYVYAESVPLTHTNVPSTLYTNMLSHWGLSVVQTFLAFDDATVEYAGPQTWQTWPTWTSNLVFRGSHYASTTGTVRYVFHWIQNGGSVNSVTSDTLQLFATTPTNLSAFTYSETLTGAVPGEPVHYWLSRDVGDTISGDVYLRSMAIGWEQE